MKRVITDEIVQEEFAAGRRRIFAPPSRTVVTPSAWAKARELGVFFDHVVQAQDPTKAAPPSTKVTAATAEEGSVTRVVDPSGLVVVRGNSIRLGHFTGAGPDKNIGLLDVVTGADGSPMTAGIMSFRREDSFPWLLDYDEVDLVLEGVLRIEIDGRELEGKAGDILYIPKGSNIIFSTPSRTRVFYVTYPANWASASTASTATTATTATTAPASAGPRPRKF